MLGGIGDVENLGHRVCYLTSIVLTTREHTTSWDSGSKCQQPCLIAVLVAIAVAAPLARISGIVATAMVAGDNECGAIAIEWVGLRGIPQLTDKIIYPMDGIEIAVVAAMMSIFVNIAQCHIEHLRMP